MTVQLCNTHRLLLEASLTPVQGQRFQPTGFADLGAATYTLPDGTRMLLVESAQSMANRLEATIVQADGTLAPALNGLSYVQATLTGLPHGEIATSSLVEAHRLNSPFIMGDKDFCARFCDDAAYLDEKPLNWPRIAKALFKYDVNSLVHGIFLANVGGGRIKTPRLLSAFIEARDVCEVVSGGVKNSHVDPKGKIRAETYDKDVYGNVPYQRIEYTAKSITAYFNVDISAIRGLGLVDTAQQLLFQLALYKIRALLDNGLRLRTACDFRVTQITCQEPSDFTLPPLADIEQALAASIAACRQLFAQPPVTCLTVPVKKKTKKDIVSEDAQDDDE